jgi:hypothetical protein
MMISIGLTFSIRAVGADAGRPGIGGEMWGKSSES